MLSKALQDYDETSVVAVQTFGCENHCAAKAMDIYFSTLQKKKIIPQDNNFPGSTLRVICKRVDDLTDIRSSMYDSLATAIPQSCDCRDLADYWVKNLQKVCSNLDSQSQGKDEVKYNYLCLDCLKCNGKASEAMMDCRVAHGWWE